MEDKFDFKQYVVYVFNTLNLGYFCKFDHCCIGCRQKSCDSYMNKQQLEPVF